MLQQEKSKQPNQNHAISRNWLKQKLSVVSEMTLGDINSAESFVHKAHAAQLANGEETAARNLTTISGRPIDHFERSGPLDMNSWTGGKVGEYYRSQNGSTFAYSRMVEEKGSERVIRTIAFTNMARSEVVKSISPPQREDSAA